MYRWPAFLVLLVSDAHTSNAQSPTRYTIGFADTLLFNDSLHYTGFGYDGPAPLFVQAWFPIEERTPTRLTYQQLRERQLGGGLGEPGGEA